MLSTDFLTDFLSTTTAGHGYELGVDLVQRTHHHVGERQRVAGRWVPGVGYGDQPQAGSSGRP